MSKAVYCDHCNNLLRDDQVVSGTMSGFSLFGSNTEEFDLCSRCKDDLGKWVFHGLFTEKADEETEDEQE